MNRRRKAATLVEILVTICLLALIATLIFSLLETGRRSYSSARQMTALSTTSGSALTALRTALDSIVFTRRSAFISDGAKLEAASDQHFVCGPADFLLPDLESLMGDAVFFQYRTNQGTTEATGFFVQYHDDAPWRPAPLSHGSPPRKFRLLQFHQPGLPDSLEQTLTEDSQAACYQWFRKPLNRPSPLNCRLVADNIILMLVDPETSSDAIWDTRRQQWDPDSSMAQHSHHRLPPSLMLHLLIAEDTISDLLNASEGQSLAQEIQSHSNRHRQTPPRPAALILEELQDHLFSKGIASQIATTTFFFPSASW